VKLAVACPSFASSGHTLGMPDLRGGEYVYEAGELRSDERNPQCKAEDKPGHRPLQSYSLPKWVHHPERPQRRVHIGRDDFFGMAAEGQRNYDCWNVAHVAAYHDDLKLLSLATLEQCKEPNKIGMTPTHMCGMGQHAYGASINVLYELVQLGVADPEALNRADQTPWHIAQRMHKPGNLKKFEKVLLKGHKPEMYEEKKEAELRPRGKFARALGAPAGGLEDILAPLPVCIVFPGQGSQYVGMLRELQSLDRVTEMLETAKNVLGYDILELCLNGPENSLSKTSICQPAMFVAGLAALEKLKLQDPQKVARCQACAGLSLGEYTALTAAEVFTFEEGLKLVKARAEIMESVILREGAPRQAMLSVAGLTEETLSSLCREVAVATGETCQIANYLFPKGFSVAGSLNACQVLEEKTREAGALQAKLLETSGAFHTQMMLPAQDALRAALEKTLSIRPPRCSVYMNVNAKAINANTPVAEICDLLVQQVTHPVMWEQSMKAAIQDGCVEFFECGPNKQLKSMMKRIDPNVFDNMTSVLA